MMKSIYRILYLQTIIVYGTYVPIIFNENGDSLQLPFITVELITTRHTFYILMYRREFNYSSSSRYVEFAQTFTMNMSHVLCILLTCNWIFSFSMCANSAH